MPANNTRILQFLQNGVAHIDSWSTKITNASKAWNEKDFDRTITEIEALVGCGLPGWDAAALRLLGLLRVRDSKEHFLAIGHIIESFRDSMRLFAKLNAKPFQFTGSLHCEATLASLIHHKLPDNSKYLPVAEKMEVSCSVHVILTIGSSFFVK